MRDRDFEEYEETNTMKKYQSTETVSAEPLRAWVRRSLPYGDFPEIGRQQYITLSDRKYPVLEGKEYMIVYGCCHAYLMEKSAFEKNFEDPEAKLTIRIGQGEPKPWNTVVPPEEGTSSIEQLADFVSGIWDKRQGVVEYSTGKPGAILALQTLYKTFNCNPDHVDADIAVAEALWPYGLYIIGGEPYIQNVDPKVKLPYPKFKKGDRVWAKGYGGLLQLERIDRDGTQMTKKVQWQTSSVDYLEGRAKVDNGEVYSEDELTLQILTQEELNAIQNKK